MPTRHVGRTNYRHNVHLIVTAITLLTLVAGCGKATPTLRQAQDEAPAPSATPALATDLIFNAYVEGWAVYAERLVAELGLYDDDPVGKLGYLQGQLYMASRIVLDTGLHALGWTPEHAAAFVQGAMGMSPGAFIGAMDRYTVWPGQATGYTVGQLIMLDLRQTAMERLGEQFDL